MVKTAYAEHSMNILFLRCVPLYYLPRSGPHFEQLLARLNLLPRATSHVSWRGPREFAPGTWCDRAGPRDQHSSHR